MRKLYLLILSITFVISSPIPGMTFMGTSVDPLTYTKGFPVLSFDNPLCVTDNYTVPCWFSLNPIFNTNLTMAAYNFSSSSSYNYDGTSSVDISAGLNIGVFSIKGSFSESNENIDASLKGQETVVISVNTSRILYDISGDVLSAPLSGDFDKLINLLVNYRLIGNIEEYNWWWSIFLGMFPIGTVSQYRLGGMIVQLQDIDDTYFNSTSSESITGSASLSASFASIFSVSVQASWGSTTTEAKTFESYSSNVRVISTGGPYIDGMTTNEWQEAVTSNPGILGYSIVPTSIFISPMMFPDLDPLILSAIRTEYLSVWTEYVANNTYPGCTDSLASNYNRSSNLNDGSCLYGPVRAGSGSPRSLKPLVPSYIIFSGVNTTNPNTTSPSSYHMKTKWIIGWTVSSAIIIIIGGIALIYLVRRYRNRHGYSEIL